MKEFVHRKEKGQLLVHTIQKHMNAALQEVGLSFSRDGLVHIGDHVMLYSVTTEGVLSCDPADKVSSSDRGFAVTTSTLVKAHVARNTFVIEAYNNDVPIGSPLKLGQQFRLRANPKLFPDGQAFYLQSQPVSALAASKVSRKQLVSMSNVKSFDTVWKAQWRDISRRFEMEGEPVPANGEIVIVHAPTNTCLSSSKLTYYNDFGLEYEVCGHSHVDIRKSQGLYAELQGRTTTDIPFRKESTPNHWAFLTAATEEMEEPLKRDQAFASSSSSSSSSATSPLYAILSNVREDLLTRGPEHLFSFFKSARLLDPRRTNHCTYDEFRKLLLQHGIKLRLEDFDNLCRIFDPTNDKHVDYLAFFRAIRGPVSESRTRVIRAAYESLEEGASGSIPLTRLATSYCPAADPDVKLGRKGEKAALDAIMEKFKVLSVNGRVSREDWEEYYGIVSTYIESDDYATNLISTTWRLKLQQ